MTRLLRELRPQLGVLCSGSVRRLEVGESSASASATAIWLLHRCSHRTVTISRISLARAGSRSTAPWRNQKANNRVAAREPILLHASLRDETRRSPAASHRFGCRLRDLHDRYGRPCPELELRRCPPEGLFGP